MNDKKTVQKISRVKSYTCETKYVESNGTQDTANQEMYTNKTESFDKYIHSNSKTAKSPREIVNMFRWKYPHILKKELQLVEKAKVSQNLQ